MKTREDFKNECISLRGNVTKLRNENERLKGAMEYYRRKPYAIYELLLPAIKNYLTKRELSLLSYRFAERMTYEEVGNKMCVTRERVRQVEARIFEKIRMIENVTLVRIEREGEDSVLIGGVSSVITLGLSPRTTNALINGGITTIGSLLDQNLDHLQRTIRGFGSKANAEIEWHKENNPLLK